MRKSSTTPPRHATPEAEKRPASEAWRMLRKKDGSFNHDAMQTFNPYDYARIGRTYRLQSNPGREFPDPFDLNNLLCIPPKMVIDYLERLEKIAKENPAKLIMAIIGTGGTIAMKKENGVLRAKLDPKELLENASSKVRGQFVAEGLEYLQLDSSQLERPYVNDLVIITSYIMENASSNLRDRLVFMITHGTDTLAESEATYNDAMTPYKKRPVCFVAAQKTTEDDFGDAGINFTNGATTLARLHMQEKNESFIYMGGTEGGAYSGLLSTKDSDIAANAFQSKYGPKTMDVSNFGLHGTNFKFREAFFSQNNRPFHHNFRPFIFDDFSTVFSVDSVPFRNDEMIVDAIAGAREHITSIMLSSYGAYTSNNRIRNRLISYAAQQGLSLIGTNPIPLALDSHEYEPAIELRKVAIMSEARPFATENKATKAGLIRPGDEAFLRFSLENADWAGEQPPNHIWTSPEGVLRSIRYKLLGPPFEIYDRVQESVIKEKNTTPTPSLCEKKRRHGSKK